MEISERANKRLSNTMFKQQGRKSRRCTSILPCVPSAPVRNMLQPTMGM